MGMCKVDLSKEERRLDESFPMTSPAGVLSLIDRWAWVAESAAGGNLAAVDLLADFATALDEAMLSDRERDVVGYRCRSDYDISEIAGIIDIGEEFVEAAIERACAKISEWFAEGDEER